jgi:superoxide dismutase, Cu-Zn family
MLDSRLKDHSISGLALSLLLLGPLSIPLLGTAAYGATAKAAVTTITSSGIGPAIGAVTFEDTRWGLLVTPDLSGLPPGVHGFHIHQKPACGLGLNEGKIAAGFAAGGHLDPANTGKHLGPYDSAGHLGDLPPLIVNADGKASLPVLAPRLTVAKVKGHSIMIHAGGDNYSDQPRPLGGGGARIACGVIQ